MKKYIILLLICCTWGLTFGQITDTADIRIFPSANHQTEVHISINKRFPNTILVSANVADNGAGKKLNQGYYYSQDGGASWTGSDEMPNNVKVTGDPVTAFDANGNYHLVSMTSEN